MKVNYKKTKLILYKIIFSLDLLIIIIIILSNEFSKNSKKEKEYTDVSHFFLNTYIIIIFLIFLGHSLYPKFKPIIIKKYFKFILSNNGKIIIIFLISLVYRFSKSIPHYFLGILLFFSSLILFIFEYILYFEPIIELLREKRILVFDDINYSNANNEIINNNNFKYKDFEIPNEVEENNNSSNTSRLEIQK